MPNTENHPHQPLSNSIRLTEENKANLLKTAKLIKSSSETVVRDAYLSFIALEGILLESDPDGWPLTLGKEELLRTIRSSVDLWQCLE